jgi:pimeloyl-ACP methyl ester carboxylesterase
MAAIEPFRIDVPDAALDDLRARLRNTRWPDEIGDAGWDYGIPLGWTREMCRYWGDDYDWRAREAQLNRFDQFRTTVDGLGVHFVHVRSPEADALPLVVTHGWPGSIVEFQKVIGPLTDPAAHGGDPADAFHVVCPSLPGYAWSDRPVERGWGVGRTGRAWAALMAELGYDRYVAQGGDWGAMVSTAIALADPEHCAALHLNMVIAGPTPEDLEDLSPREQEALDGMAAYDRFDSGYAKQQSTRPQTLAYGLVDSPAAQAAWILEKFWSWTDCDGDPENALTRDEMLDNVSVYWFTATGGSSARMYWESFGPYVTPNDSSTPVAVPTGCSIYPHEIFRPARHWAERRFPITYWNELDRGGHFAAFEQPELFVQELRTFFRDHR